MVLFERLLDLLDRKGVSKNRMLTDLKINPNFFNDLEKKGASPSFDKIVSIADYFNVSTDYLIGNTDIPTKVDEMYNDRDIVTIQRLRTNMSSKNRDKMMTLLKLQFEEDFPEDEDNENENKEQTH